MTTASLHGFSQPQKTDRAFIFSFQRWVKVFVISFRPWFNFAWWIPEFRCCYLKAWIQRAITEKKRGLRLHTKATIHSLIMLTRETFRRNIVTRWNWNSWLGTVPYPTMLLWRKWHHIYTYCFLRGHGNESCNLIGSLPGQYFPVSAYGPR